MAAKSNSFVKNEEESSAEGGKGIAADDNDLDALLDDALKDFSKDDILSPAAKSDGNEKQETKHNVSPASRIDEKYSAGLSTENFENMFSEESIARMAEEFSKVLQNMPENDVDMLRDLGKQESDSPKNTGSSAEDDRQKSLEDNLEEAMASMAQNLKNMKDECHDDDIDKDCMQAMKGLGLDSLDGNPDGFLSAMQGMMTNLLSKDILYPSLKEIQARYPAWLEEQKSALSKDDYERFKRQQDIVCRICCEFESERECDSDDVKNKRVERIMELMQKMQACGQPPFDLLGETAGDARDESEHTRPNIPNPEQCIVM